MWIFTITRSSHSESFEKKDLNLYTAAGPQAFGEFVVSKTQGTWLNQISGVQDRVRLGAVLTKGALLPDACLKILNP
ncbi:MAG: hypothetical protein IPL83_09450 [Bdellovibrionales bacterium]|nr:hypothetical protein [Bdellovibrionales bacterium]